MIGKCVLGHINNYISENRYFKIVNKQYVIVAEKL